SWPLPPNREVAGAVIDLERGALAERSVSLPAAPVRQDPSDDDVDAAPGRRDLDVFAVAGVDDRLRRWQSRARVRITNAVEVDPTERVVGREDEADPAVLVGFLGHRPNPG